MFRCLGRSMRLVWWLVGCAGLRLLIRDAPSSAPGGNGMIEASARRKIKPERRVMRMR